MNDGRDLVLQRQLDLDREQDVFAPLRHLQQQGILDATSFRTRDLPRALTIEEAVALAATFTLVHRSSAWWIGDLFRYSESQHGEEYAQLEAATDLAPETITDYVTTAMMVAPERRIPGLSFRHHRAVRKLPPEKQTLWLRAAVEQGWSSDKLRHELGIAGEIQSGARGSAQILIEVAGEGTEALTALRRLRRDHGNEAVSPERAQQMAARLEREQHETEIVEVTPSPVPTPPSGADCDRLRRLCVLSLAHFDGRYLLGQQTIERLRCALGEAKT